MSLVVVELRGLVRGQGFLGRQVPSVRVVVAVGAFQRVLGRWIWVGMLATGQCPSFPIKVECRAVPSAPFFNAVELEASILATWYLHIHY